MKPKLLAILAAAAFLGTVTAAEPMTFAQLPVAVQQTIRAEVGDVPINKVEAEVQGERVVYAVLASQPDAATTLIVGDDGSLLRKSVAPGPGDVPVIVSLEQVPAPVQQTIAFQGQNRPVAQIERRVENGQVVFEVAFQSAFGSEEMMIGADGTVLGSKAQSLAGAQQPAATVAQPGATNAAVVAQGQTQEGASGAGLQLPVAVRMAIEAQGAGEYLMGARKQSAKVYEFRYNQEGKTSEIAVTESGQLLIGGHSDAAGPQFGYRLSDPVKIEFDVLPAKVKETIRAQAGPAPISHIETGKLVDVTLYQARYVKEGEQVVMRVQEDGTLAGLRKAPFVPEALELKPIPVQLDDVPEVVLSAFENATGKVQLEQLRMRPVTLYILDIGQNGQSQQLVISENGALLGGMKGALVADAPNGFHVPLQDSKEVAYVEVPAPVQQTISARAGEQDIASIKAGDWQGTTVYEFELAGNSGTIQVRADGSVVDIAAGANRPASTQATAPQSITVTNALRPDATAPQSITVTNAPSPGTASPEPRE